jgi:two pore calcium channel protein 1/two pore calcium channel protein 3
MSAGWSTIVFDYAYRDKDLTTISIFMGSFVFLSIFLLALTGGLIWEVFIIVDKSVEN